MLKAGTIAAAGFALLATMGAAMAQSRDFVLEPFDAVDIGTGLTAIVSVGGAQAVRAESRRNDVLDKLEIEVRDGTLHARLESNFFDFIMGGGLLGALIAGRADATIHISVPEITGVASRSGASVSVGRVSGQRLEAEASSGASIALDEVTVGALAATASSGASISARGSCETLDARASSGASANLGEVVCRSVSAQASSGASIGVHAREAIRARASSGGSVSVDGDPSQREVSTSSGGSVRQ